MLNILHRKKTLYIVFPSNQELQEAGKLVPADLEDRQLHEPRSPLGRSVRVQVHVSSQGSMKVQTRYQLKKHTLVLKNSTY